MIPRSTVLLALSLSAAAVACGDASDDGSTPNICDEIRCEDSNDCTLDVCDPDDPRVCVFTEAAEGAPCNDGGVCDGAGNCVVCNEDQDCPSDLNECTLVVCDANTCVYPRGPDGVLCVGGECQDGNCALSGFELPCTDQAIRNAAAQGGGPYTFDCDGPTTVVTQAEIAIDRDLILDGEGNLMIDGNDDHRLFRVYPNVVAELERLILTNGRATRRINDESCGALLNQGTLTLRDTTVVGNTAESGGGAGICSLGGLALIDSAVLDNDALSCAGLFNTGLLKLTNSTVSGNTATAGGGGICSSGTLELLSSTVSGNRANRDGGIESSGLLVVSNSTISGNASNEGSAAVFNFGTATLVASTLYGNELAGGSGDIRNVGTFTVSSTLIGGGCTEDSEHLVSSGYNLEASGDTCGLNDATDRADVTEAELLVSPLADNGGPTMTHALLPESVAVDAIPADACEADEDQRGAPRPEAPGSLCDIGAFELQ